MDIARSRAVFWLNRRVAQATKYSNWKRKRVSRATTSRDQTLLDLDELFSLRLQTITKVASRVHAKLGKSSSWPTIRTGQSERTSCKAPPPLNLGSEPQCFKNSSGKSRTLWSLADETERICVFQGHSADTGTDTDTDVIGSVRDSAVNLLSAGTLDLEFAPSSLFKHGLLLLEAIQPGSRLLKYYLDPIVQSAGISARRSRPTEPNRANCCELLHSAAGGMVNWSFVFLDFQFDPRPASADSYNTSDLNKRQGQFPHERPILRPDLQGRNAVVKKHCTKFVRYGWLEPLVLCHRTEDLLCLVIGGGKLYPLPPNPDLPGQKGSMLNAVPFRLETTPYILTSLASDIDCFPAPITRSYQLTDRSISPDVLPRLPAWNSVLSPCPIEVGFSIARRSICITSLARSSPPEFNRRLPWL
ncbi:hypothetical protein ASPSYDRAFT_1155929 [Aspergillus sydowii CBS 593.65]|uniref:Uncharacterized protein n=1 Tax=Aspergillus sydowii CBS 593.65 TaxID=1036612 RepID=A0A1L9TYE2_9EURO|nr:uncharacterized protein ASPSYDRAFT_1155929 [Aspergillus sydowii CBS 593.65]OJJ64456.1 hypothetical protein ASPSYDRAFT_1155929 [Aspergillus sydowii CBS 593.65]